MGRHRVAAGVGAAVLALVGTLVVAAPAYARGAEGRIRRAVAATQDEAATQFSFEMTMDADGRTVVATGDGAVTMDAGNPRGSIRLEMSSGGREFAFEERILGDDVYIDLGDAAGAELPDGATWVRLSFSDLTGGLSPDPTGGTNPSSQLDALQGIDDARQVSHEDVEGVPTTHYEGTVDLEAALRRLPKAQRDQVAGLYGGATDLPVEVWIDDENHVRRMTIDFDLEIKGQDVSATIDMVMRDFGGTVDVQAPPEDQVIDYDDLLAAGAATAA
jgi:hypothetical protein